MSPSTAMRAAGRGSATSVAQRRRHRRGVGVVGVVDHRHAAREPHHLHRASPAARSAAEALRRSPRRRRRARAPPPRRRARWSRCAGPATRSRTARRRPPTHERERDAVERRGRRRHRPARRPPPSPAAEARRVRPAKPPRERDDVRVVGVHDRGRRRPDAGGTARPSRARRLRCEPRPSRCAGPTLVMTPTSGAAISASRQISPGSFMPISTTATRLVAARRSSVSGRPIRLFRLPCVFSTARGAERRSRIAGQHLLGRGLAVAAGDRDARGARRRRRWNGRQVAERRAACRATTITPHGGGAPSGAALDEHRAARRAPPRRATKACPSCVSPRSATKSSPGSSVRCRS